MSEEQKALDELVNKENKETDAVLKTAKAADKLTQYSSAAQLGVLFASTGTLLGYFLDYFFNTGIGLMGLLFSFGLSLGVFIGHGFHLMKTQRQFDKRKLELELLALEEHYLLNSIKKLPENAPEENRKILYDKLAYINTQKNT